MGTQHVGLKPRHPSLIKGTVPWSLAMNIHIQYCEYFVHLNAGFQTWDLDHDSKRNKALDRSTLIHLLRKGILCLFHLYS